MTRPVRWREEGSDASELERSILRAEGDAGPPTGAEAEVWTKLSTEVGLPGSLVGVATLEAGSQGASGKVAAATSTAAAGGKGLIPAATGSLGFVKGVVVGVLATGAVWQGQQWLGASAGKTPPPPNFAAASSRGAGPLHQLPPKEPEPAPVNPQPQLPVPVAANPGLPARPEPPALVAPNAEAAPSVAAFRDNSQPAPASTAQRASQLREEAELLRQARARLRAGDLTAAFALLETSRQRGLSGELYQEREALSIELLRRSGQVAAANERARIFLATFPESPHAGRLRSFNSAAVRR